MDDFALFHDSKITLKEYRKKIVQFLQSLRLVLKPERQFIAPTHIGHDFLGYRIFITHRLVRKPTVYRYSKRFKRLVLRARERRIPLDKLSASLFAWFGHVNQANSYNLKRMMLGRLFSD